MSKLWILATLLLSARICVAADSAPSDFQFFQQEAAVVTASRQPSTLAQAPSTTYVVTSEDIRASGAQTIWDALRTVPGVDVMSERTAQGDVGIRGLNSSMNDNVLVLLDGKTVLNGMFDTVDWESIPVTLEEIDRIEVVEGPASALYGTNAVSGVINIITKTPEQLKGGIVSYTGGERDTQMGTALVGDKSGAQSYKLDMGWRSTNMFSNANRQAESVGKAHAFYGLDLPDSAKWSIEGGVADQNINVNTGPSFDDGETGFLRTDFNHAGTKARAFWNWGNNTYAGFPNFAVGLHYDTYDLDLEQSLDIPFNNALTGGVEYRRNLASSLDFAPGWRDQAIWSMFAEDSWKPADRWKVVVSAREDHNSLTNWEFSPRGSVIYSLAQNQTLRATASSAYKDPDLYNDYFGVVTTIRSGITVINSTIAPDPTLRPEKIQYYEVAYRGDFDWIKTSATGFYYRVTDAFTSAVVATDTFTTTPLRLTITDVGSQVNNGETKAIGGEFSSEFPLPYHLSAFANYSYQSLIDQVQQQTTARSAPKDKINGGLTFRHAGVTAAVSGDWVSRTFWTNGANSQVPVYDEVPSYFMLNCRLAYAFSGRWDGLEAAVSGFNIAQSHYETLPVQSSAAAGQNAEIIDSRWSGTLSYRFGL